MNELKNAEKWADEVRMLSSDYAIKRKVEEIQLNAIQQGMMMAAATFHRHCTHTDKEQEQTYFRNASELRAYDEIIAAADNLKLP